jgi:hypothetical protein
MAKMRGLLHTRPKVDEEEAALAASRVSARLADLFGDGVTPSEEVLPAGDSAADAEREVAEGDATPLREDAELGPWAGHLRPPIVVVGGEPSFGDEANGDEVELVGVMARTPDEGGDDSWAPLLARSTANAPDAMADEGAPQDGRAIGESVVSIALAPAALVGAPFEPVSAPLEHQPAAPTRSSREGPKAKPPRRSSVDQPPSPRPGTKSARTSTKSSRTSTKKVRAAPVPSAHCPYCALLMQPPPASSRRCDRCRQRVIVKRVEGRAVYLTEAAVLVFEAERRRVAASGRLTRERDRWLRLAAAAAAPAQRQARLAAAPLSEEVVGAARTLYLGTVDRAFRDAKRDKEWESASRIRREQASVLYRMAGSPLPPPSDVVALYREGVVAELRGIAEMSRDAELVGASCCDACRADDRQIFRITPEMRAPRLPHAGCPKGLCRCGWDLAARDRSTMRRLLRRRPRPDARSASEPSPEA